MRTNSNAFVSAAILATLILVAPAFANHHTALNGTWTLLPAKSDFAGQPVIQTGSVTIDEREGIISVSRNFVYQGASETFYYKDMTEAQNGATIHDGKDVKSKSKWDHDILKVTTTESGATTVESYSLAADGTMVVNVVRPGRPALTLFFERK